MEKIPQMMIYILSFLITKERDCILILSFLLPSILYTQTILIVEENQVHLKRESNFFVDEKKNGTPKYSHSKSFENIKIHLSSDVPVTNIESQILEIVEQDFHQKQLPAVPKQNNFYPYRKQQLFFVYFFKHNQAKYPYAIYSSFDSRPPPNLGRHVIYII